MKKITFFMAAIAMVAFSTNSFAQSDAASGDASATIVLPIQITKGNALVFGSIVPENGGSIAIAADGSVVETGARLLDETTTSAGSFTVTGETGTAFTVSLPASTTISDKATTPNTMSISTFVSDHDQTTNVLIEQDGVGTATFNVGATLDVAAGQAAGDYAGTYEVTVQYL